MGYNLFTFTDGEITINKIEILTVPSFKKILYRDKDRTKKTAFKEFAYIYHMADPRSKANTDGMTDKAAHKYAISMVGLESTFLPDMEIREAVKVYYKECVDPATEAIQELIRTYNFTTSIFKKVRRSIEDILNTTKLTKEQTIELMGLITTLIQQGKDIPALTKDLRAAIVELEQSERDNNSDRMRGTGETIPSSADPDRDYTGG